jgi:polyhydroxyalkanoate synthase subunit PhaE
MAEGHHTNSFGGVAAQWIESWRAVIGVGAEIGENWSNSMLPFIMKRAAERGFGVTAGNDLADAIERMAKGPRLADVADFDRKLAGVAAAWSDLQAKLLTYQMVASRPWLRAAEQYKPAETDGGGWRQRLGDWNEIANEELIVNQRSEEFLVAQKQLLQAATEFKARQSDIADIIAAVFGLPTQRDFDVVTRQLTELRREVRALERRTGSADEPRSRGDA